MPREPQVTVLNGPHDGDEISCAEAMALLCAETGEGGYEIRALVPAEGGAPVAYELVYYSDAHIQELLDDDEGEDDGEDWQRG